MQHTTVHDCKLVDLRKIHDVRGNLTPIEGGVDVPFDIKRVYWVYDVPGGECRGGHAYKLNEEVIIALSGSMDVVVDDGQQQKTFSLNRSYYALYVPKGLWREMNNFSTNSVALELGSTEYDKEDYVFDYELFKTMKQDGKI